MPLTNYAQEKVLDAIHNATALTSPTTLYFGLSTTTPAEAGTGVTEPSGGAYARVAVTCNTTNFPNATGGTNGSTISNGTAITWPTSTATWGTVTYLVVFDALTGGNLWEYGALTSSYTIGSGTTFSIPSSDLTITLN